MVNNETLNVHETARTNAQADYCRRLCKVLTRYATPQETAALAASLEDFTHNIIKARPAQGLNDAAYHLYGRFCLAETGLLKPQVKP
ncbi:MAG: hypothetical protein Q8M35_06770 [Pseudohongiella sp.]|nr:hypothetical protein [Pseudohongiella sp.]